MTFWWTWWLAALVRRKKSPAKPVLPAKPKARRVPAYRRADGTDELRRIH